MFPICIAIGYYIGRTLDGWLHTGNKMMMFFVICGVIAAFLNLFKEVKNYDESNEPNQTDTSDDAKSHELRK